MKKIFTQLPFSTQVTNCQPNTEIIPSNTIEISLRNSKKVSSKHTFCVPFQETIQTNFIRRMIKKNLLLLLIFFSSFYLNAQDFNKRYSFSKAYFGMDFNYVPNFGNSSYLYPNNNLITFNRNGFITPAFNLAASHFWGHADFYVSINTANIKLKKDEVGNITSLGAATGIRIYPFPIQEGKLRPFIGYKFSPLSYSQRQQTNQHSFSKTKSILDLGVGYKTPSLYVYAGYNQILNPEFNTFVSRTQTAKTSFPSHFFNVGVNWSVETTKRNDNKKTKQVHELLDSTNTAGFFFGIGPSSIFPLVLL
jgi:hypothetical protein